MLAKDLLQLKRAEILSILKGNPGEPGKNGEKPSESELLFLIMGVLKAHWEDLRGKPGKDGETPSIPLIVQQVMAEMPTNEEIIEDVLQKMPSKEELQGKDGEPGRVPRHEWTGEKLRFENPDGTMGEWIDIAQMVLDAVKKLKLGRKTATKVFGGVVTTGIYTESLTSQCDGSNKVFTTSRPYKTGAIVLMGQDHPVIYDPATDFTESGEAEITLTDNVDAPLSGQRLVIQYAEG